MEVLKRLCGTRFLQRTCTERRQLCDRARNIVRGSMELHPGCHGFLRKRRIVIAHGRPQLVADRIVPLLHHRHLLAGLSVLRIRAVGIIPIAGVAAVFIGGLGRFDVVVARPAVLCEHRHELSVGIQHLDGEAAGRRALLVSAHRLIVKLQNHRHIVAEKTAAPVNRQRTRGLLRHIRRPELHRLRVHRAVCMGRKRKKLEGRILHLPRCIPRIHILRIAVDADVIVRIVIGIRKLQLKRNLLCLRPLQLDLALSFLVHGTVDHGVVLLRRLREMLLDRIILGVQNIVIYADVEASRFIASVGQLQREADTPLFVDRNVVDERRIEICRTQIAVGIVAEHRRRILLRIEHRLGDHRLLQDIRRQLLHADLTVAVGIRRADIVAVVGPVVAQRIADGAGQFAANAVGLGRCLEAGGRCNDTELRSTALSAAAFLVITAVCVGSIGIRNGGKCDPIVCCDLRRRRHIVFCDVRCRGLLSGGALKFLHEILCKCIGLRRIIFVCKICGHQHAARIAAVEDDIDLARIGLEPRPQLPRMHCVLGILGQGKRGAALGIIAAVTGIVDQGLRSIVVVG